MPKSLNFYELKEAMHHPAMAGTITKKSDLPVLVDILQTARQEAYKGYHAGIRALIIQQKYTEAKILASECVRAFDEYSDDIALIIRYLIENGIEPTEE